MDCREWLPVYFAVLIVCSVGQAACRPHTPNLAFASPWPVSRPELAASTTEHGWGRRGLLQAGDTAQNDNFVFNEGQPFPQGVASGDPQQTTVILWTRVQPTTGRSGNIAVNYTVSIANTLGSPVTQGTTTTNANVDYTVKVNASGLSPNQTYYYQFSVGSDQSRIGRARTLPPANADVTSVRFAVVSCSNLPFGYFNVYQDISRRTDIDYVLHLGDWVYEYANGEYGEANDPSRVPAPNVDAYNLSSYRIRHRQYRSDQDLIALSANYTMIIVWDDHDAANNAYCCGAQNHNPETQGPWDVRKAAAIRAHHEYLPSRTDPLDNYTDDRIYQRFQFGNLIDLMMLDTRLLARTQQPLFNNETEIQNSRMLGDEQKTWLKDNLQNSVNRGATWRIIGQQVVFSQLTDRIREAVRHIADDQADCPEYAGGLLSIRIDWWDGYPTDRRDVLTFLRDNNINNTIILTGDIHSTWAFDVPLPDSNDENAISGYNADTGEGSYAVEFVCTSVTSPFIPIAQNTFVDIIETAVQPAAYHLLPHLKFVDLVDRGYLVLDVNKQRAVGGWVYVSTIDSRDYETKPSDSSWQINAGTTHLVKASSQQRFNVIGNSLIQAQRLINGAAKGAAVAVAVYSVVAFTVTWVLFVPVCG